VFNYSTYKFTDIIPLYAVTYRHFHSNTPTPGFLLSPLLSFLSATRNNVPLKYDIKRWYFTVNIIHNRARIRSFGGRYWQWREEALEWKPAPVPLVYSKCQMDRSELKSERLLWAVCCLRLTI